VAPSRGAADRTGGDHRCVSDRSDVFDTVLAAHALLIERILSAYERRPAVRAELRQEVAVALWQALPRFRGDSGLKTYVARIANNIGVSHVRRDAREGLQTALDEALPSDAASPEHEVSREQLRLRLAEAIRALPLGQKQVVVLHLEDFDHGQIAATLGIAEGAVAVRLLRARQALASMLAESRLTTTENPA
jgi:RNA polymerase sigma-70 factor (ECF subfamily)